MLTQKNTQGNHKQQNKEKDCATMKAFKMTRVQLMKNQTEIVQK